LPQPELHLLLQGLPQPESHLDSHGLEQVFCLHFGLQGSHLGLHALLQGLHLGAQGSHFGLHSLLHGLHFGLQVSHLEQVFCSHLGLQEPHLDLQQSCLQPVSHDLVQVDCLHFGAQQSPANATVDPSSAPRATTTSAA
jgi:hypothetical protein